jgi:uncharacterized phage protein gp47/JayE
MPVAPQIGVPFVPGSLEEIRDQILADTRLEAINRGVPEPAVQEGTDLYLWATADAAMDMLHFSNVELSRNAITPLNATGQDLEDWRDTLSLPEVKPSGSFGKIVIAMNTTGAVSTISDGEPFLFPNGKRGKVLGTWIGITDGSEVDAVSVDTGASTNYPADTEVRFLSPPANVSEKAKVSKDAPMVGGTDFEGDDRKRSRVINSLANKPGGGNWGQLREVALEAIASIQDAFVYPAPGGPGSALVVPVRDFDDGNLDWSRALSSAALTTVRNAVYNFVSDGAQVVVRAAANQPVDVSLLVTIPASSLSGGNGQGWTDQDGAVWPLLVLADSGRVAVTSASAPNQITVGAQTTTAPVVGLTHVMWWSSADMRFRTFLVTGVSGGTGAWVLTLDRPLAASDGSTVAAGDYICPAAANADAYGSNWIDAFRKLGPGELTSDPGRLPRALRRPLQTDESPGSLSFQTLEDFKGMHAEVTDITWSYRSSSAPTVPVDVNSSPNVLTPRRFAIYRQ